MERGEYLSDMAFASVFMAFFIILMFTVINDEGNVPIEFYKFLSLLFLFGMMLPMWVKLGCDSSYDQGYEDAEKDNKKKMRKLNDNSR